MEMGTALTTGFKIVMKCQGEEKEMDTQIHAGSVSTKLAGELNSLSARS